MLSFSAEELIEKLKKATPQLRFAQYKQLIVATIQAHDDS